MREIPLTGGGVALVDDEDYERVASVAKWQRKSMGTTTRGAPYVYAQARVRRKTVMMHRLVLDAPKGLLVDHINHDGLDNRRSNLRLCTPTQNCANGRKCAGASSEYRGVQWHKAAQKWIVECGQEHVGLFQDETVAACAYDVAAFAKYGEFAALNFPKNMEGAA